MVYQSVQGVTVSSPEKLNISGQFLIFNFYFLCAFFSAARGQTDEPILTNNILYHVFLRVGLLHSFVG